MQLIIRPNAKYTRTEDSLILRKLVKDDQLFHLAAYEFSSITIEAGAEVQLEALGYALTRVRIPSLSEVKGR